MVNVRVWVDGYHVDIEGSSFKFDSYKGVPMLAVVNDEDGKESRTMFNLKNIIGFDIRTKGGEER
jgi:hypothetical protein